MTEMTPHRMEDDVLFDQLLIQYVDTEMEVDAEDLIADESLLD